MMIYDRNNGISSNHSLTFETNKALANIDCHSLALNDQETRLLLVGNHELAFINVEKIISHYDSTISDDANVPIPIPSLADVEFVSLFDVCNTNRSIVQWNPSNGDQYAVAIDRVVHMYTIDHAHIKETNVIIDSQHQRPISTIAYSPHDPHWLLTGSLDGQVQVWDTRHCTSKKSPPTLKLLVPTPFSIRRIQWSPNKADNANQLAVQCDRCIRIYDIRRADSGLLSKSDIEHTQRITSMDWTQQTRSIATLSMDQSIRIFSNEGRTQAESLPNEHSSLTSSKIRATMYDDLFVCASRDTNASTYGFVGWRWDEDQYLRPLTDRIISTTSSSIVDFCFVKQPRFLNLLNSSSSTNRFLLLTWCRDGHLSLVDMDSTFRQAWNNHHAVPTKPTNLSDSSSSTSISRVSSNIVRQQGITRSSSTIMTMDVIKDETTDGGDTDEDGNESDDNAFHGVPASPPNIMGSSGTSDEHDYWMIPNRIDDMVPATSIEQEMNSLGVDYGAYVSVENKDEQRRLCIVRCHSVDKSLLFRIYLVLSRHYPTISQLFVRFKLSTNSLHERLKALQTRIQIMFDETSSYYFYHGQLCLNICLVRLQNLLEVYYKQEKELAALPPILFHTNRKRDPSSTNSDIESITGLTSSSSTNNSNVPSGANNNNNNNSSSRMFTGASSSSARTSDSQISGILNTHENRRTCGARFAGGTHLVCFGRIGNHQPISSATVLPAFTDGPLNRPQSLPMRSTSLTVAKSRENSSTDEHIIYRPPTTNIVQIQHTPINPRTSMFSAPVRSSLGTSMFNDQQRLSISYRRSLGQITYPPSTISIYDISILLPVSRKLADDYRIDLNNTIEMCAYNEELTRQMAKDDLAHCWRLLGGMLSLQTHLEMDNPWFQTPIAQGLIKHLVSNYVIDGDIQSASMFLLAMSASPFMKTKFQSKLIPEHHQDHILYSYASLLHRWKHFYKRTQILSQIDHNCQSPAPFAQSPSATTTIICSICLQPVLGQHFLCAVCGHGGHLRHLHEWFSSEELKHKFCPEKDCTCRCIVRQQELLATHTGQVQAPQQQQAPSISSRSYMARQSSGNIRP